MPAPTRNLLGCWLGRIFAAFDGATVSPRGGGDPFTLSDIWWERTLLVCRGTIKNWRKGLNVPDVNKLERVLRLGPPEVVERLLVEIASMRPEISGARTGGADVLTEAVEVTQKSQELIRAAVSFAPDGFSETEREILAQKGAEVIVEASEFAHRVVAQPAVYRPRGPRMLAGSSANGRRMTRARVGAC